MAIIHKEGYKILSGTGAAFLCSLLILWKPTGPSVLFWIFLPVFSVTYLLLLNFFRNPGRSTPVNARHIIAPADGKVVVIEEVMENEYFKDRRIQVSVFMSPLNVHVNRYPVSGTVSYLKYHPGKFLVAWHPKSSTENERNTVVVKVDEKVSILFRQIAGVLARRILCYAKLNDAAGQGKEFGFIRFGSRVDVFLPLDSKINVSLDQHVHGGETVLAELNG